MDPYCLKDERGNTLYYIGNREVPARDFFAMFPDFNDTKCKPWCEVDEKGQKIYHASTGRVSSLKQMKNWYKDFNDDDCRSSLISSSYAEPYEEKKEVVALRRQITQLEDTIAKAVDKASEAREVGEDANAAIIRDLREALRICQKSKQDCDEAIGQRTSEVTRVSAKLSEKELLIQDCLNREKDVQTRYRDLESQSQEYINTINRMRSEGGLAKETEEQMRKSIAELESLRDACRAGEQRYRAEQGSMQLRLDEAEKKIQSAGDICFASEESARNCLARIRDMYPGLAGLMVQNGSVSGAILTDGTVMRPQTTIPIPPPLIATAKKEVTPGTSVIPIRPTEIPTAPTLTIPMAQAMSADLFKATQTGFKLNPSEKVKDKEILKAVKESEEDEKKEMTAAEKMLAAIQARKPKSYTADDFAKLEVPKKEELTSNEQMLAAIRARKAKAFTTEDLSRLETKKKGPVSKIDLTSHLKSKLANIRATVSDDDEEDVSDEEW
jgi:hypothetical protein